MSLTILPTSPGIYRFNTQDLQPQEQDAVRQLTQTTFNALYQARSHAFTRCTFFADGGYGSLKQAVTANTLFCDPRIMAYDQSPFDQHYWLEVDLQPTRKPIMFDPICDYIGLRTLVTTVIYPDFHYFFMYPSRIRRVAPNAPRSAGGVRIKTISI